ncbi:semaphorin-1A [Lepeophtheirus salmonis]|uniref:semaphorin-1A n=1 Tax=Lepeophtheirus salmonis TaxID=72036 RepID=UPI001AE8685D|nr:semaphorin-1A-like [Lepeophtheirus salmonis]
MFVLLLYLGWFWMWTSGMVCAWQRNERPRLFLEMSPGDYVSFGGNESEVDYFRVMLPIEEGKYLLLGARNVLYKVELRDDLRLRQKLEWKSEERVREDCLVKGKTQRECQNYISVLAQYDQDREKYILCGTNAFKPLCREYTDERGSYVPGETKTGIGLCPYSPDHNSTAILVGEDLFSGTFADHAAVDPIIIRGSVKTRPFDSTVLNSPDFVGSFSDSDFVYFFFREGAVEYFNCGKAIFSRVARVCKNDPGGTGNHWMSFIKTRLNCSVPGAYPFYFDEIQGVSELILGSYGDDPQESLIFYATFSTPSNSIGGSAVCAYSIKDINKSFIGKFKEQRDTSANWLPVSEKDVPKPRPGTCINENDTNSLGDVNTNFIKSHTLMDETVPPLFGSPVVIRTGLSSRFTTLAVDPQISTTDGRHYDIIFTGTTNGYILKSINALGPSSNDRVESVIIEELKVFEKPTIIKKVQVVGGEKEGGRSLGKLVIMSDDEIRSFPVQRCDRATTCPECVALRDPYCAWDVRSARCGSGDWTQNMASSFIQSVSTGEHSHCLAEIVVQDGEEDNKGKWYDRIQPVGLVINIVNREKNSLSKPETKDRTVSQNNPSGVQGVEPNTVLFSLETLVITVSAGAVAALVVGFVIGYCCGRKCGKESGVHLPYPDTEYEYFEQRQGLARPLAPLLPTSSDKLDPRDQEEVTYAEPELVSRPVPSHLNALNSGGGKYYDGDRFGSSHYSSSLLQPNKFNTIHSSVSKRNKAHNDSLMLGGGGGVGGGLHFINDPPGVPATLFNAGNRRENIGPNVNFQMSTLGRSSMRNNGKSSVNGDSSNDGSQPQVVDSAYGTTRSVKKVYL